METEPSEIVPLIAAVAENVPLVRIARNGFAASTFGVGAGFGVADGVGAAPEAGGVGDAGAPGDGDADGVEDPQAASATASRSARQVVAIPRDRRRGVIWASSRSCAARAASGLETRRFGRRYRLRSGGPAVRRSRAE
jgi:hypothetical protein